MRAILYTRRSTDRQDTSHAAQLDALRSEAQRKGWTVAHEIADDCSGSTPLEERAGGGYALALCSRGEADVLAVSKLDRLCRSVVDGARVLERCTNGEGWALVALDLGMDTSTAMGRAMAHVALAFAELERERIRERTREGLAEARRRGAAVGGPAVSEAVVRRIVAERERGASLPAIARMLTEEGVPTARGGKRWWPSTVRSVLGRAEREADPEAEE